MDEVIRHIDEIATHLVSVAIWERLHLNDYLALGAILVWLQKTRNSPWWSRINKPMTVGLYVLTPFIMTASVWSAFQAYHRSGFVNGTRFAGDCFLFLALTLAVIYTLRRKFLPDGIKRLNWAKDRGLWRTETSPRGKAAIVPSSKGLQFGAQLRDEENRWAKMEILFNEAQDYRAWAGISFDIRCEHPYPDTYIRLEVKVPNVDNDWRGSIHRVEKPFSPSNGRLVFLFQEMWQPEWSLENPWHYLNLRQIVSVAVVCNTTCDVVEFYVDNFALVKFTDIPS